MKIKLLATVITLTLVGCSSNADTVALPPVFHEPFENAASLEANGAVLTSQAPDFVPGLIGNAADFAGSRAVCYPAADNFSPNGGTIQFWVTAPEANGLGYFDIGQLGSTNSWGIFLNSDHFIMEVKNNRNSFDQAWQPSPSVQFDARWHLVSAVWELDAATTSFRVCYDGNCKDSYDGKVSNSFPDISRNFCIAWNAYYGFSESKIDELKLFDFPKSNAQILGDFVALESAANPLGMQ